MVKNRSFPIFIFIVLILPLMAVLYFFNTASWVPPEMELSVSSVAGRVDSEGRARIDLIYGGKVFRYTDDLIEPTDHIVAEEIFRRKINAPLDEKLRMVDKALSMGSGSREAMLYAFPLLEHTVEKAREFIDAEPVDSIIKFNPDKRPMFTVSREKVGFKVIDERLYHDIYKSLTRNREVRVAVIAKTLMPKVTYNENQKMTRLRASFSTDYAHSNENRKHNIRVSLKKINGTVLKPGEEFSFNKVVGKRTERNGFKTAKIILNGEYTEGVGGGVCQASTALYNCALRADMDITSVRNHSLVSSYVPPSFDAMVNSGTSDLKFRNGGSGSVFIRVAVGEGSAKIEIYGTALEYRIACESVVVSKSEPPPDTVIVDKEYKYVSRTSTPGEKHRVSYSHGALKSEGYLLYYSHSGRLIKRKLIRKDSYSSVKGLVAITPGEVVLPQSPPPLIFDNGVSARNEP